MDEQAQQIQRLKDELDRRREEVRDLKAWIGRDIDRDFSAPVEEFSEKELESHIREHLAAINLHVETKPDLREILSHRRTIGKPIAFLKRALLQTTFTHIDAYLDRQTQFNRRLAALIPALLVRAGHAMERARALEEKVAGFEEDLAILRKKLEGSPSRGEAEPGVMEPERR